jgi:hypothetical protein
MRKVTSQPMLLTSSTISFLRPPSVALMAIVLAGLSPKPMTSTLSGQQAPLRFTDQATVADRVASPAPPSTAALKTNTSSNGRRHR